MNVIFLKKKLNTS